MKKILIILFITIAIVNITKAQDTLYIYKAGNVIDKHAVSNIDSITFTKPAKSTTGTLTDIDGNIYHWITLGNQTWMVENLKTTKYRTGESISNVTNATLWSNATFGAYCAYENNITNGAKYGYLYNWNAVVDSRKIAPAGWHIPTDAEWTILVNYLIANGYNYDGTTTGNYIAKSLASTTDWSSYSSNGTVGDNLSKNNKTGFTALPAGLRNLNGSFSSLGTGAYWWSSTPNSDNSNNWGRGICFYKSDLFTYAPKDCGLSVRCIKD
ncbi:fibrobacter succinogenes major paralogous domain-containing protein [Parabacteroides sp. FAFU027]|uniref:fibrobacter succinogenes major paralogous domain-containing protein n=1 Tax=Parabacteroides sp. FAFU027 TaxID=2922715 RepID=UPI001FAF7E56|nr:fibrobacter succinogenes major paralogous domain-containing protein [Parabacteroides sp. FAFU027]